MRVCTICEKQKKSGGFDGDYPYCNECAIEHTEILPSDLLLDPSIGRMCTKCKINKMSYLFFGDDYERCKRCCGYRLKGQKRNKYKNKKFHDQLINKIKKKYGCQICGESDPIILEFHHYEPSSKEFRISAKIYNISRLFDEINKCVVLCCNCHRRFHRTDMTIDINLICNEDKDDYPEFPVVRTYKNNHDFVPNYQI